MGEAVVVGGECQAGWHAKPNDSRIFYRHPLFPDHERTATTSDDTITTRVGDGPFSPLMAANGG